MIKYNSKSRKFAIHTKSTSYFMQIDDEVLRHTYGDYMQLPPEKDRIGHHYFKAYRKDE